MRLNSKKVRNKRSQCHHLSHCPGHRCTRHFSRQEKCYEHSILPIKVTPSGAFAFKSLGISKAFVRQPLCSQLLASRLHPSLKHSQENIKTTVTHLLNLHWIRNHLFAFVRHSERKAKANASECLTITTNALPSKRMAYNYCSRICCEYAFLANL